LHIYVFFWIGFLVSVLKGHSLIALAAVTLHDVMQFVRLSKPRSGAKYSLISYFFADSASPCDNSTRTREGERKTIDAILTVSASQMAG
jgi:hypothetical protein